MSAYSFLRINIMKEIVKQALALYVTHRPVLRKETTFKHEVSLLQVAALVTVSAKEI